MKTFIKLMQKLGDTVIFKFQDKDASGSFIPITFNANGTFSEFISACNNAKTVQIHMDNKDDAPLACEVLDALRQWSAEDSSLLEFKGNLNSGYELNKSGKYAVSMMKEETKVITASELASVLSASLS